MFCKFNPIVLPNSFIKYTMNNVTSLFPCMLLLLLMLTVYRLYHTAVTCNLFVMRLHLVQILKNNASQILTRVKIKL